MIDKIDIKKFGLFKEFLWDKSIGKDNKFAKLNIIYGRNYSGKTTLARVFKCIEDEQLHINYRDAEFTLHLTDGCEITNSTLDSQSENIQIRVYNTDFVNKNLSWLHKEDGTIEPFTILGSINVELDNKIKAIDEKLGSEESKKGLLFELSEKTKINELKNNEFQRKNGALESKLKSKANDHIKVDNTLFLPSAAKKTYQINDIKNDIETVLDNDNFILTSTEIETKKKLLAEQSKPEITERLKEAKPNFEKHFLHVKELIKKNITPNKPITDLINDTLLQEWVRQGVERHKGKRTTCGFCGNKLPSDLWEKIDAHFSKESEELRDALKKQIEILENVKTSLLVFIQLNQQMFYSSLSLKYEDLMSKWNSAINLYSANIDILIKELQNRYDDIFKPIELADIKDNSDSILNIIEAINKLIDENNQKTLSFSNEQQDARKDLRLSVVAQFAKDIDFKKSKEEIENLEKIVKESEELKIKKQAEIYLLIDGKKALERQAKDESRGAELVNQHLTNFFGHDELKLVSEGEAPNIKFKITRGLTDAKNLSEGECSLISFCYFIAKMEDEMKDELNNQKLIIYIDDPISSLDSNHIFFMYSLIDTVIAKPKKYGQLFISTHNLDFLKFLKRLTVPDGKKENINHFLVERRQKQNDKLCLLVEMPSHIRDYVTEFNYLFNEIYKVHKECKGDKKMMLENTYNQFYNLPNNIRKFLECYLFFRYPNNDDLVANLNKLFDGNVPCLINRVVNEYSHLTYIDRGWKPIDVDEAEDCATIIVNKIKEKDPDQYEALLNSIN